MQRPPHAPSPSQQTQLSSSLNQSRCVFNYWEQRGSLFPSQPSNSPIPLFCSLHVNFSLCLHALVLSLSFPPHLPGSLISCLLHLSYTAFFVFMVSNHSCSCFFLPPFLPPPASSSFTLHQRRRHHLWTFPRRCQTSLYLPRRIGSSIFDCCEILRRCHDNRAPLNLMQYSEAMI